MKRHEKNMRKYEKIWENMKKYEKLQNKNMEIHEIMVSIGLFFLTHGWNLTQPLGYRLFQYFI